LTAGFLKGIFTSTWQKSSTSMNLIFKAKKVKVKPFYLFRGQKEVKDYIIPPITLLKKND